MSRPTLGGRGIAKISKGGGGGDKEHEYEALGPCIVRTSEAMLS